MTQNLKVLMYGWEFPPFTSGGLSVATYHLTKSLSKQGLDITFVMPKAKGNMNHDFLKMIIASWIDSEDYINQIKNLKIEEVDTLLMPYLTPEEYEGILKEAMIKRSKDKKVYEDEIYGKNLYEEVHYFKEKAREILKRSNFDIIHAHDWMTFPAAIDSKKMSNKPLVLHVHATEFDRTVGHPNQIIYEIEKAGFHSADVIIAVSNRTKKNIVEHYGIDPNKVEVVHNSIEIDHPLPRIENKDKIVLYLGRITIQKGPEHFLWAAKKVLEVEPDAKFVMAGKGDMLGRVIDESIKLGIQDRVAFTGFLQGDDIAKAYSMAKLYVMPSISEPFGLTPLESIKHGTPVLISKQSGVSEVLEHSLKVDFWDINQMANKIVSVLRYKELETTLVEESFNEVLNMSWDSSAKKCINIYQRLLS